MQRRLLSFVFAPLCLLGCGPQIHVPPDAALLFYGPPLGFNNTRPSGPGRVFLRDETLGKVVAVIAVSDDQNFRFNTLDVGHTYSVYFQRDLTLMSPAAPTTVP